MDGGSRDPSAGRDKTLAGREASMDGKRGWRRGQCFAVVCSREGVRSVATEAKLAALTDLSGAWIDRVRRRRPPDGIILDMDSSESPAFGQQGGSGL
jgi:hypothetical protein